MTNPTDPPVQPQPWECPRCHAINAPHATQCTCPYLTPEQQEAEDHLKASWDEFKREGIKVVIKKSDKTAPIWEQEQDSNPKVWTAPNIDPGFGVTVRYDTLPDTSPVISGLKGWWAL